MVSLEELDTERVEPALYQPCRVGIAFFKALKILQSQTQSMLLSLPSHLYLADHINSRSRCTSRDTVFTEEKWKETCRKQRKQSDTQEDIRSLDREQIFYYQLK